MHRLSLCSSSMRLIMKSFICKRSFRVNVENCEKEKNLWTFVSFFSPWWHLLWPGPRLYIASQSSITKRRQRRSVLALAWARAPSPSSFPNSSSFRKLHCLLMPSRLSPPTTNNNNRHFYTLSSFCHFCLQYFMCNTQKQHDNNLRLVSSIPVFTPSDVLHGGVWAFWSFRILITFIETEISGKEFDCDIFGLAV